MTDKTMTLEPCPFCGTDDHETSPWPANATRTEWVCNCGNPDCAVEVTADTPEGAVAKWNRRHLSQPAARGEAVAWLCVTHDGSNVDAVVSEFARDTYKHTRTITPLYTAPPPAAGVPDDVRERLQYACDLLAERKYGSDARSAGHNARLVIERVLSATPSPTIDVAVCGACFGTGEVTDQNGNKHKCYYGCAIGDEK